MDGLHWCSLASIEPSSGTFTQNPHKVLWAQQPLPPPVSSRRPLAASSSVPTIGGLFLPKSLHLDGSPLEWRPLLNYLQAQSLRWGVQPLGSTPGMHPHPACCVGRGPPPVRTSSWHVTPPAPSKSELQALWAFVRRHVERDTHLPLLHGGGGQWERHQTLVDVSNILSAGLLSLYSLYSK